MYPDFYYGEFYYGKFPMLVGNNCCGIPHNALRKRHLDTLLVAVQHQQQRNQQAAMVSGQCSGLGFRVR